jgi:hypothetical protein
MEVRRGDNHISLSKNKELLFIETKKYVKLIYHKYKYDCNSPINYILYRKAMATYLCIEGRYYGNIKGISKILQAIYYNPINFKAWLSFIELLKRGVIKVIK